MPDLLDDVTAAAGLTVFGAAAVAGAIDTRALPRSPLDWSPDYDVVPRVTMLRTELRALDLDRVVLAGDGAPARAADAIARTLGVPLTVLTGTDPGGIAAAVAGSLRRTVVVLTAASPISVSLAVDSHRRAFLQAFEDQGIQDLGRRFVFVTRPGSPLATTALEMGAQLFLAQPGPLSAYSLVPAGLAGADINELVEQAFALAEPPRRTSAAGFSLPSAGFSPPSGFTVPSGAPEASASAGDAGFAHPAVALGAALAAAVAAGRDKIALAADGSGLVGLGEWVAALLDGAGARAVPVVLETPSSWGHEGPDVLSVTTGGPLVPGVMPGGGINPDLAVNGPLGVQLLVWEQALTIAGLIGTAQADAEPARSSPAGFGAAGSTPAGGLASGGGGHGGDDPSSHEGVLRVLDTGVPPQVPAFVEGAVEVHGAVTATTLIGAIDEFARSVPPGAALTVLAHLDRTADAAALGVRTGLAGRVDRAVHLAWGGAVRFARDDESVQAATGVGGSSRTSAANVIQITGAVPRDLAVPGRPYTFGELQAAEAADDRQVLLERGRPLLRLHLTDRKSGIDQLLAALGG
ncbi:glucose-6-phosphate isomerase [Dactylosporangium sp. CA-152071]|uniref:glucose-6-phosphate isomerase n=1 Tax=Dactylosporangium sp. CA-152071 TaxID=3239933 RepID=UPI003D940066